MRGFFCKKKQKRDKETGYEHRATGVKQAVRISRLNKPNVSYFSSIKAEIAFLKYHP